MTETGNIVESSDPVIQRVPLALRQEFEARWDAYGASCRLRRPDAECAMAYEQASEVFHRYCTALRQAQADHDAQAAAVVRAQNREKARSASATPRLKIRK